jgi:hypothetical protein
MQPQEKGPPQDEPLPGTLAFVFTMGAVFAILWFLMFVLLKSRW